MSGTQETGHTTKSQSRSSSVKTRFVVLGLLVFVAVAVAIVLIVCFSVSKDSDSGKPNLTFDAKYYTQLKGSNIQIPCTVSDSKDMVWYFNGNKIMVRGRFTLSGNALKIENIQPSDGGEYVCETGGKKAEPLQLAVVEVILKNVTSHTGEGPHWDYKTQTLLFVDLYGRQFHRWNSLTGKHEIKTFPEFIGHIVPYKNGGYIVTVGNTINYFYWETEEIKKLHEVDPGTINVINDGKVDPMGRSWGGTAENDIDLNDLTKTNYWYKGSMYMMDLDGSLHMKWENISISNGFAWSLDNTTMYYVDSVPGKLYKFDYDVETGDIEYMGVAVDFENKGLGYPDGICIDEEGMIWVACYSAGKVIRYNPNTGDTLRIIDFKGLARRTTSVAFGGPNFDVMYVTCGGANTDEEVVEDLYAGSLFRVTGLGVKGLPGRIYQGVV